jgi:hypothetical protein
VKITSVSYRRLKSHPNRYGHDAIEAHAQVSEGESSEEALAALRAWVLARLTEVNQTDEAAQTIDALDARIRERERKLKAMGEEIETAKQAVATSDRLQLLCRAAGFEEELKTLFGTDEIPF